MEFRSPKEVRDDKDFYWTKHWQKNIGYTPHEEINYKTDDRDRFSDHYSVGKTSGKYSDRDRY